jgi:hypothetical protein
MPAGAVVFASTAAGEFDEHGGTRALSLYSWREGDRTPTRITFSPSSEFEPTVLADGRLLYSSWQHVGASWPRGNMALLAINSDGTGIFPYHGSHQGSWLKRGIAASSSGVFLHIEAERFDGVGAGKLVATQLNDSFAPAMPVAAAAGYDVADVSALGAGEWIVSARKSGSDGSYGLYLCEQESMELLRRVDGKNAFSPAISAWPYTPDLRFSTVVPGTEYGYLLILDIHETDRDAAAGSAEPPYALLRVIEGLPASDESCGAGRAYAIEGREQEPMLTPRSATGISSSRILAEIPPAEDGSVYLTVPADRPLRIQLIDSEGFTAMDERAWFWLRPNERRVCIGCHEDRELSPSNRAALAASRQPTDVTQPEGWQQISYVDSVRPIIRQTCAVSSCHRPPDPTAAMNLSAEACASDTEPVLSAYYEPAYANLLSRQPGKPFAVGGRRIHVGSARQSPLVWMLYGRPLAPQYEPAPFERPMLTAHPGPMLPEHELALIRKWIDLGAPYGCAVSAPMSNASSVSQPGDGSR